jgi:GNAT superfamily N-acetyltransferase
MSDRLRVECHRDVAAFRAVAGAWMAAREAEHNLPLAILGSIDEDPAAFGADPALLLSVRTGDGTVVATAIQTPPWRLVLSEVDDPAALPALAEWLAEEAPGLPGVVGPAEHAGVLAAAVASPLGLRAVRGLSERAFRLDRVIPPAPVPGRARLADPRDRELVLAWHEAFEHEAIGSARPGGSEMDAALRARVDRALGRVGARRIWLWDDDGPVAMTGMGGPTPTGIRIGPVYTPPDRRRRGYASALVAAASQAALDEGRRQVFLFTDLANPTSNHIYAAIGYEPVRDVDEWSLVALDAGS